MADGSRAAAASRGRPPRPEISHRRHRRPSAAPITPDSADTVHWSLAALPRGAQRTNMTALPRHVVITALLTVAARDACAQSTRAEEIDQARRDQQARL